MNSLAACHGRLRVRYEYAWTFLAGAVQNGYMADSLDERARCRSDQPYQDLVALLAVSAADPDFDQLVVLQRARGFRHDPIRQSCATDQNERTQRMGETAQELALLFGQVHARSLAGAVHERPQQLANAGLGEKAVSGNAGNTSL